MLSGPGEKCQQHVQAIGLRPEGKIRPNPSLARCTMLPGALHEVIAAVDAELQALIPRAIEDNSVCTFFRYRTGMGRSSPRVADLGALAPEGQSVPLTTSHE